LRATKRCKQRGREERGARGNAQCGQLKHPLRAHHRFFSTQKAAL
jgi:hypothetical protein